MNQKTPKNFFSSNVQNDEPPKLIMSSHGNQFND